MSPPSVNLQHLTQSKKYPGQDFKTHGHYNKVESRSHHDVANLQPISNVVTSINYLHFTVSEISPTRVSYRFCSTREREFALLQT